MLNDVGNNGFGRTTTANEVLDRYSSSVTGRTFLVTGAATPDGIGFQLAIDLAKHGKCYHILFSL